MQTIPAKNGWYAFTDVEGIQFKMWGKTEKDAIDNLTSEIKYVKNSISVAELLGSVSHKGDTYGVDLLLHRYAWLNREFLRRDTH